MFVQFFIAYVIISLYVAYFIHTSFMSFFRYVGYGLQTYTTTTQITHDDTHRHKHPPPNPTPNNPLNNLLNVSFSLGVLLFVSLGGGCVINISFTTSMCRCWFGLFCFMSFFVVVVSVVVFRCMFYVLCFMFRCCIMPSFFRYVVICVVSLLYMFANHTHNDVSVT